MVFYDCISGLKPINFSDFVLSFVINLFGVMFLSLSFTTTMFLCLPSSSRIEYLASSSASCLKWMFFLSLKLWTDFPSEPSLRRWINSASMWLSFPPDSVGFLMNLISRPETDFLSS